MWLYGLSLVGAGLVALSAYRAATAGFVHDECTSFEIFTVPGSPYVHALNHHVLNTWCMELGYRLVGSSELALRAHTLVAHAVYVLASVLIVRRLATWSAQLAGFALLNLNLFALDYFFLARGYGVAMGAQLLSLYLLLEAVRADTNHGVRGKINAAIGSAAVAVVANYAFLNYFLPACAAGIAILCLRDGRSAWRGRKLLLTLATVSAVALFLGVVLQRMFAIRSRGEMYWGGETGFVADVVGGLVRTWLYDTVPPPQLTVAATWFVVAMAVGAAALALWRVFHDRAIAGLEWVALIGTGSVVLTAMQHLLLGTPLPIERQALYFLAPFAIVIATALDCAGELARPKWMPALARSLAVGIAAVMVLRFTTAFSVHSTLTWRYDASTFEALELIARDREQMFPGQAVQVGNNWQFEPSIKYYKRERGYAWMSDPTRSPLIHGKYQYIYVMYWESIDLPKGAYSMMKHFKESDTALLRMEPAARASEVKR